MLLMLKLILNFFIKHVFYKKFRNYHEIKLYRSITLLKTLNKTLKSIIIRKLTYITKKHNFFFENYIKDCRSKLIEHVIHALIKKIIIV